MLANHTSIHVLLSRLLAQYDKLRKSGAFLNVYRKEAMFSDNLDEFDNARETVQQLVEEYKACEKPDYITYGSNNNNNNNTTTTNTKDPNAPPSLSEF